MTLHQQTATLWWLVDVLCVTLTWLGGVDARRADHLREGGAKGDLNGALLRGGLLVVLRHWLVVWGRGMWRLMHGRRLDVLAGQDMRSSQTEAQSSTVSHVTFILQVAEQQPGGGMASLR